MREAGLSVSAMMANGKLRCALLNQSWRVFLARIATILFCLAGALFSQAAESGAKPILKVAPDGFPGGHGAPEGAAADLARAFIRRDPVLFTNTCVRVYSGGKSGADYSAFLKSTIAGMRAEAAKKAPSSDSPKSIGKVFAACHLSQTAPVTYGRSTFKFQDIMFVDVGVFLYNGGHALFRTLVIKDSNGRWYAHPAPSLSPSLSSGLNDEPKSKRDFSEVYSVRK
jgi:hypothetical protein